MTLKGSANVADLDWSHNGNILASLHDSSDSSEHSSIVSLIHAPTRAVYETFEIETIPGVTGGTSHGCSVKFGNKSRYLLVAECNESEMLGNRIQILDVKKRGGVLRKFSCKNGTLRQASFDPTDTFVTTMTDDEVGVYRVKEGTLEARLGLGAQQRVEKFVCFQFSPHDSNIIAVGTDQGSIHVWNLNDSINGLTFPYFSRQSSHHGIVTGLAFSPVNKVLLSSCGLDRKIQFYDIAKKKEVQGFQVPSAATAIAYHQVDWTKCAVGLITGEVYLYDLRKLQRYESKQLVSNDGSAIKSIHFPYPKPIKKTTTLADSESGNLTAVTQEKAATDLSFANKTITFTTKNENRSITFNVNKHSPDSLMSRNTKSSLLTNVGNNSIQSISKPNDQIDKNQKVISNNEEFVAEVKDSYMIQTSPKRTKPIKESPTKPEKEPSSLSFNAPSSSPSALRRTPKFNSENGNDPTKHSPHRHIEIAKQKVEGKMLETSPKKELSRTPADFGGDSLSPISKTSEFGTPVLLTAKKDIGINTNFQQTRNEGSKADERMLESTSLRPSLAGQIQHAPNSQMHESPTTNTFSRIDGTKIENNPLPSKVRN